jgi:hypothetical protein
MLVARSSGPRGGQHQGHQGNPHGRGEGGLSCGLQGGRDCVVHRGLFVLTSPVSDPIVPAGKPDRVCIDPMLSSGVPAGQTWTCVYIADRELGTGNDTKHSDENYDEASGSLFTRQTSTRNPNASAIASTVSAVMAFANLGVPLSSICFGLFPLQHIIRDCTRSTHCRCTKLRIFGNFFL